jgi:glucose-6-phosphate isomerase
LSIPRLGLAGAHPELARAIAARLQKLEAEHFAAKLAKRDAGLWGSANGRKQVAQNRLGWLGAPSLVRPEVAALREFASMARNSGYTHALLLGMGGSSLAPDTMARSIEARQGAIPVEVLDNTSPQAVEAAFAAHDPATTLVVVSSKSGTTLEVSCFEQAAHEWVRGALGDRAGGSFVGITDPGTPLERLAKERGYRRVFLNPEDIGGRYSALSFFGMVPAALMGLDLDLMLDGAIAEVETLGPKTEAASNHGLWLGAALGELALAGRDKVTLVLPPPLEALGGWIEQLLAESTGKEGRGLIPVDGEPLGPPDAYGDDRVFVVTTMGAPSAELAGSLAGLEAAGHPVLQWSIPSTLDLGVEFVRWEIATATAGAVLDVNPFDEPNVAEAKQATKDLLERRGPGGALPPPEPAARRATCSAAATPATLRALRGAVADPADPIAWAAALPSLLQPGDYFALLAFLHPTPDRHGSLQALRHAVQRASHAATTLGYGPRFLHSTGQLHKGGPNRGVFLQIVADEGDRPIPGESFGFGILQRAQALGDFQVLGRHERRVLRLDLGADVEGGLVQLAQALVAGARARTA